MVRLLHYSDIENVYDTPERAARLAGCLRARAGEDTLVIGTGDNTAPGVLPMVCKGRQALAFFDAAGTDVETFGNHDFDFGPRETRNLIVDASCQWVSANVFDHATDQGRMADAAGSIDGPPPFGAEDGTVPWLIERVAGVDVGVFGLTDPATDSLNPMAAELRFADPYRAADRATSELREAGADLVVACSHLGNGDDQLAREVGVDVVLGGHVHTERAERIDGVLCTRPGVNGRLVWEIELAANEEDRRAHARVTRHDPADFPPDDGLAADLEARRERAGLDDVVARIPSGTEPIERTASVVHGGESRIGNFVADAYRWAADADVGLQNSGGIREGDPLTGAVTVADLIGVLPFEEPVVTVELTGAELLTAFRQMSASVVDFGEPDWWHGHLSGASIVWDETNHDLVEATVAGEPVDSDRLYTVATAEYLLHSDHEFPVIEERHRVAEHGIQHEVLAAYAREHGITPTLEGRITRTRRQ